MPTIDQRSRRRYLATLGTYMGGVLAGCVGSSEPHSSSTAQDASTTSRVNWPTIGHDQANTRRSETGLVLAKKPIVAWRRQIKTPGRQPIVANGRVYIPDQGVLHAYDAATGEEIWTYSAPISNAPSITEPTVRDGVVYVGLETGPQSVVALDAKTGTQLWTFGGSQIGGVSGTPTLDEGGTTLYVGTTAAQVYALDAANGTPRWHHEVFSPVVNTLAVRTPLIIATTRSGEVYAFRDDGTGLWQRQIRENSDSPPVFSDRWLFVGGNDQYVYNLEPVSGRLRWKTHVDRLYQGGFATTTSTVYVTSGRGIVALGGRKGTMHWSVDLGDAISCAPTIIDETLYIGGPRLSALKISGGIGIAGIRFGTTRWTADLGAHIGPGLAVGSGRLFAPVQSGTTAELVALEPQH